MYNSQTNRNNYSAQITRLGGKATPEQIEVNKAEAARKWFNLGKSDRITGRGCCWARNQDYLAGYNYTDTTPLYLSDPACGNGAPGYRYRVTCHSNTFPDFKEELDLLVATPGLRSLNKLVKRHYGSRVFVSSAEAQATPF